MEWRGAESNRRHHDFQNRPPSCAQADTVSVTIRGSDRQPVRRSVAGALDAGVGDALWGSMETGFVIAFPFALLANRYMIASGKGCPHAMPH
jgi:hypothetical protein